MLIMYPCLSNTVFTHLCSHLSSSHDTHLVSHLLFCHKSEPLQFAQTANFLSQHLDLTLTSTLLWLFTPTPGAGILVSSNPLPLHL